jgi:soluble lytic murein transglycosylase
MSTIGLRGRVAAYVPGVIAYSIGRHRQRLTVLLLASAMMTPAFGKTTSAPTHRQSSGHHGAAADAEQRGAAADSKQHGKGHKRERLEKAKTRTVPERESIQESAAAAQSSTDLAAVKEAIGLVRHHKFSEASALAGTLDDPGAQKLIEWVILRDPNSPAGFDRYAAFVRANPDWPGASTMRRRSEARLWQERRDPSTVRRFVGGQPASAIGRLALARVLQGEGDRDRVEREVKAVWASVEMSAELETAVASEFTSVLTSADDVARMDRRIGAKDFSAAMRAAKRLGPGRVAIVKACEAAEANSKKAKTLLGDVPDEVRGDLGYVLCRLHWLQMHDDFAAAARLLTETSLVGMERQDTDEWWRERRLLARKLLDLGDAPIAYRVVREAAIPANPYYRSEYHFMAGWIALRFLNDPAAASAHFAHVDDGSNDPVVLARAGYWRGRAAEAMSQSGEMRAQYEAAAAYPTAYYGQLARARLGHSQIALFAPLPATGGARADLVHAADILYGLGEFDLVLAFVGDFAETTTDVATLNALGELTAHYHDAQAMLALGKTALARGLPTEQYAFPEIGVPAYKPIAPPIDHCLVYAIVRTESAFNQADASPAKAVGLMQVTPEAGRDTAKRFGISYDWKRLVSDPVYNTQMGAAELSALFKEYAGSYVMTFAGYNAGRGRVRQWVAQHGDPRDPNVDEVDWVERIPISETRNYVQRVMENLQMYGARLGATVGTLEPNLHRGANVPRPPKPFFVNAIPD